MPNIKILDQGGTAALIKKIQDADAVLDEKIEIANTNIAQLTIKADSAETDLTDLKTAVNTTLPNRIKLIDDSETGTVAKLAIRVTNTENVIGDTNNYTSTLIADVSTLQTAINSLNSAIGGTNTSLIEALEKKYNVSGGSITGPATFESKIILKEGVSYGTASQREAISNPSIGQVFFVTTS